jgi:hypothetical protein
MSKSPYLAAMEDFDATLIAIQKERVSFEKGNKSAGTRLRKQLLKLKQVCHTAKAESINHTVATV